MPTPEEVTADLERTIGQALDGLVQAHRDGNPFVSFIGVAVKQDGSIMPMINVHMGQHAYIVGQLSIMLHDLNAAAAAARAQASQFATTEEFEAALAARTSKPH